MKTSETVKEIFTALIAAQAKIGNAAKSSDNPFFGSKYADLAEVMGVSKPALAENKLAIIQAPSTRIDAGGIVVEITTRIIHGSGEWIEDTLSLKPVKQDPQGIGSCISYGRRYSWSAFCGIAQEDDDGAAASGTTKHDEQKRNSSTQAKNSGSNWDLQKIQKIVSDAVRDEVIKQGIKTPQLISLFTEHNGDQDAILKAITKVGEK